MAKEVNIRAVVDGLREYNGNVFIENVGTLLEDEARKQKAREKRGLPPEAKLVIQDAADQSLIDSLSDRN